MESSRPVATSEDIQKRLVRPTPLRSQTSSSPRCDEISRPCSSKPDLTSQFQKKIKRLEDYLDPVLLSTFRAKIGAKRKNYGIEEARKIAKQSEEIQSDWFEWHGDHRKLIVSSGSSRGSRSSRATHENITMDLELDSDSTGTEELHCTPFQQFEKVMMNQFKP